MEQACDRLHIYGTSLLQAADQQKKLVSICLFCGGAVQRRKIGGPTVPVAAGSRIEISRRQTAHHLNRAWAYRISVKKLSPAPGIKLIRGPGPQVRRFLHRLDEHLRKRNF
jgi:hypothetical protein